MLFPLLACSLGLLLGVVNVASLYTWKNLSDQEYKQWYTKHEIVHLEDDNQKDENVGHIPFSWYCAHPHLSTHVHFKMGLDGYSDVNDNKLRPLIDELWLDHKNVTLVFIGDSLIGNRIQYFLWDIKRIHGDLDGKSTIEIARGEAKIHGNNYRLQIRHVQTNKKIHLQEAHLTINEYNETTKLYYGVAERAVDYVNYVDKRNALIMLTMGAWFNDEDKFVSQMTPVVSWLQSVAQRKDVKNKVVWLTATPQHFETSNGYYHGWGPGPNGDTEINQCKPLVNIDPKRDWRTNLVREHLHNISDQYIEMYDDREIYWPLYNHHASNTDCTHYCYHPIFQMPLYEHMTRWLKSFDDNSAPKAPPGGRDRRLRRTHH